MYLGWGILRSELNIGHLHIQGAIKMAELCSKTACFPDYGPLFLLHGSEFNICISP